MDEFLSSHGLIWFLIGAVFVVLEMVLPGFIILFFGLGALITAGITALFNCSLQSELFIFSIASLLSLIFLRRTLKSTLIGKDSTHHTNDVVNDIVGKTGTATSVITPNTQGSIKALGTTWSATSEHTIAAGDHIRIDGFAPQSTTCLRVSPLS